MPGVILARVMALARYARQCLVAGSDPFVEFGLDLFYPIWLVIILCRFPHCPGFGFVLFSFDLLTPGDHALDLVAGFLE